VGALTDVQGRDDRPWFAYQVETAAFFRALGLDAEVGVRLPGVRTVHEIDVVVRGHHVGFDTLWLVECKQWHTRVSKLHVLALREIVSEVGADRGILMAEHGFQPGAVEAARLTNVQLTTLARLRDTAARDIHLLRVKELQDRVDACRRLYSALDREFRIEHGLRPHVGQFGYSANRVLQACELALAMALREQFPVTIDPLIGYAITEFESPISDLDGILRAVEPLVIDVEGSCRSYTRRT
jgi:hypothetical protein